MVLRKLRFGGPSFEEIGLPDAIRTLADEHRGLILVTGPTGSGKTTTLAAMIDYINQTKPVHIVTIEDPIEVLHKDDVASINQREVGNDTNDFLVALRAALRQDPDVILIGEMRDTETVRAALAGGRDRPPRAVDAAHGGRHRDREPGDRLLPAAPAEAGPAGPGRRRSAASSASGSSRRSTAGARRALEILVNTGRVAERIADPDKTLEIKDVIADGGYYGMVTFDQWLLKLLQDGKVTVGRDLQAVSSRHDFELAMQQAGMAVPV